MRLALIDWETGNFLKTYKKLSKTELLDLIINEEYIEEDGQKWKWRDVKSEMFGGHFYNENGDVLYPDIS